MNLQRQNHFFCKKNKLLEEIIFCKLCGQNKLSENDKIFYLFFKQFFGSLFNSLSRIQANFSTEISSKNLEMKNK